MTDAEGETGADGEFDAPAGVKVRVSAPGFVSTVITEFDAGDARLMVLLHPAAGLRVEVKDGATDAPLAGAEIVQDGAVVANTDGRGEAMVERVAQVLGLVPLGVRHPGYASEAIEIDLRKGTTHAVVLYPAVHIACRVVDEEGRPRTGSVLARSHGSATVADTDDDGRFELDVFAAGERLRLHFSDGEGLAKDWKGTATELSGATIVAPRGRCVQLRLVDAAGERVPECGVLTEARGYPYVERCGADGIVTLRHLDGLPLGTVVVEGVPTMLLPAVTDDRGEAVHMVVPPLRNRRFRLVEEHPTGDFTGVAVELLVSLAPGSRPVATRRVSIQPDGSFELALPDVTVGDVRVTGAGFAPHPIPSSALAAGGPGGDAPAPLRVARGRVLEVDVTFDGAAPAPAEWTVTATETTSGHRVLHTVEGSPFTSVNLEPGVWRVEVTARGYIEARGDADLRTRVRAVLRGVLLPQE